MQQTATSTNWGAVILSFLLTGVVVNFLIQRWQHRNWVNQQRFLGAEKTYESMKATADEISISASKRLSAMFRVTFALDQSDERLEERRKIYSDALDEWNQKINSFYYKTTLFFGWSMTKRLEDDLNAQLVSAGALIEASIRKREHKSDEPTGKKEILKRLYSIQGMLGAFNRDMLRSVMHQQAATYQGVEINYSVRNLVFLSTWQLFKMLFITRVDDFRVVLTSFQLEPPAIRKD